MINKIKIFFERYVTVDVAELPEAALKMATAALLIEMVRADAESSEQEYAALQQALSEVFSFSQDEARQLSELAESEMDQSACLHQFTRLINQHFDQEKVLIIEMLWRVAYADGRLDRYEEYLLRKLADLLYVSHRDYLQAKHRVLT